MRSSLVLRNENIPGMRQEHADDDADVALPMALPWMHELAMPSNHCESRLPARTLNSDASGACGAFVINSLEVAFFPLGFQQLRLGVLVPPASVTLRAAQRGSWDLL